MMLATLHVWGRRKDVRLEDAALGVVAHAEELVRVVAVLERHRVGRRAEERLLHEGQ